MRQMQELRAEARTGTGKGPSYRVRQRGLVPGVVYGGDGTPENVAVNARELERHVETGTFLTTLFALDVDGKKTRVIPRQLQLDPVSDRPVHVDFMRLPEGATITLKIPVRFKGQLESPGLKRGGVLNIVRHEVELICPADIIPEFIEGDLAGMEVHDSLHISHFKLPEGVRPTVDRDFTIASIVAPTSVIEEQRAAAAAAAAAGSAPAAEEAAAPAAAPAAKAAEKK